MRADFRTRRVMMIWGLAFLLSRPSLISAGAREERNERLRLRYIYILIYARFVNAEGAFCFCERRAEREGGAGDGQRCDLNVYSLA